jgi:hypothetical protein
MSDMDISRAHLQSAHDTGMDANWDAVWALRTALDDAEARLAQADTMEKFDARAMAQQIADYDAALTQLCTAHGMPAGGLEMQWLDEKLTQADADKAAAVEAEREACTALADQAAKKRQAQIDGPDHRSDRAQIERWRVGRQQAEIIAAAIRARCGV